MALPTPATGIRSEASSSTSRTPMVRSRISSSVLFDFILGGADKPLMVMLPLDAENEDRGGGGSREPLGVEDRYKQHQKQCEAVNER